MNNIPLVDLKAQYAALKPEIDSALQRIFDNTSFILGREVAQFEEAFSDHVGVDGAVGVASGTGALHLALLACGVGAGDEVITTAHTFFATAEAVSQTGAKPVFVDIDPLTYNLDPDLVEGAITERTKAIIPVHLYGQPAEMAKIVDIAQRHGLYIIEDAAQAHGAEFQGQRVGSIGHLGCFSFYPGKNLGAYGDGGMVVGNDLELLEKVRRLRNHGRVSKYEHLEVGWGERLDALQAAVLGVKLQYIEEWTELRRDHAHLYTELLADVDVVTPFVAPDVRHVFHLYVIRVNRRDNVLDYLKKKGIGAGIHYPIPLHQQPAYRNTDIGRVSLPVTEQVAQEVLSLPMYPELKEEQIRYIVDAVKEAISL